MCKRAVSREAFGKPLAELGGNYDVIADSRIEIEMCRLLVLRAAWLMDKIGNRAARDAISQIKVGGAEHVLAGNRPRDADSWRGGECPRTFRLPRCGRPSVPCVWLTGRMRSIGVLSPGRSWRSIVES